MPLMSRHIELRTSFGHPPDRVYAALTDENCLRERLAEIGGRKSELVSYSVDGGTTTAVMRQGIDAEYLPGIVRRITPHGVTIDRAETWRAADQKGTVEASVHGFTGSLHGTTAVTETAGGSELVIDGEIRVGIPLIGGTIETVIAEQLGRLLRAEAKYTNRWLDSHQA